MKTFANDPAFPDDNCTGLTIREYFAALAMQGQMAYEDPANAEDVARYAVRLADALITALNEEPKR